MHVALCFLKFSRLNLTIFKLVSLKVKLMNVALLWINDINKRVRVLSTFRSGLHQVIGMCRGRLVHGRQKQGFFA